MMFPFSHVKIWMDVLKVWEALLNNHDGR